MTGPRQGSSLSGFPVVSSRACMAKVRRLPFPEKRCPSIRLIDGKVPSIAQQQFGGAERSRRQNQPLRVQLQDLSAARVVPLVRAVSAVADNIAAVRVRGDFARLRQRSDFGTELLRLAQIVEVETALTPVVAAEIAFAAQATGEVAGSRADFPPRGSAFQLTVRILRRQMRYRGSEAPRAIRVGLTLV